MEPDDSLHRPDALGELGRDLRMGFTWLPIKCPVRQPARMGKIYLYYKGGKGIISRRKSRMGGMEFMYDLGKHLYVVWRVRRDM